MINLFFKKLFGSIPSTGKYVKQLEKVRKELADFNVIAESSKLQRYNELAAIIQSSEHIRFRSDTQNLKYKGSREYNAEIELKSIEKDKNFRMYRDICDGQELVRFKAIDESGIIDQRSDALQRYNNTLDKNEKKQYKSELDSLNSNSDIVFHSTFIKSKKYRAYLTVESSKTPEKYSELKQFVESAEFTEQKAFLTNPKRYETTDGYKLDIEYKTLKVDTEIVWYFKKLNKNKFEPHRKWKLIFEDTFKGLDSDKWLTIPLQGMITLNNNSYVTEDNLQFHTDNKNLSFNGESIVIETRNEKTSGRKWRPETGFQIEDFDYTSGLINTGHNFRYKEGLLEVVARMTDCKEVVHAISLKSSTMVPHIDLLCTGAKKGFKTRMFLNIQSKPDFEELVKGINLSKKFLYSLEWSENKLIWRVNGFTVAEYQGKVPTKQLYLSISSVLLQAPTHLPAQFEIDSVRVFEKQN